MTAKRRIFIGDIQGCREELEALLERVRFDPAADELHPAGDLVNRGPDSLGVLRLLRSLDAGGVLGNHDVHLLRTVHGTREVGRRDTLDEFLGERDEERDELLAWLARRPFVRAFDDVVLVHAAIHPRWQDPVAILANKDPLIVDDDTDFATRARYCSPGGKRPKSDWPPPAADSPYQPWYRSWQERAGEGRTAVFGHWARAGLVLDDRVRGLDTGCVWGKCLTAWIAEEDCLVQVPARRVYSPMSSPESSPTPPKG